VPLLVMKLSRLGICSRSEAAFARSRKRWVLSNWIEKTCLMPLLSEQFCGAVATVGACADAVPGITACAITIAAAAASRISRLIPNPPDASADSNFIRAPQARRTDHNPHPVMGGLHAV